VKTTDPSLQSFVDVAADSPFPIQNLPYGAFTPAGDDSGDEAAHVGVRIGDHVLDLTVLTTGGAPAQAPSLRPELFRDGTLNALLAAGRPTWTAVRQDISQLLRHDEPALRDDDALRARVLVPVTDTIARLPVDIGDYTDFYSSKEHATNVGTMFRGKDNALMPNWSELPVAYHGRASSIVIDGTPVRRPSGQMLPEGAERPVFGPCRLLDIELEVGFFTGPGNALGRPIPVHEAHEHIFGLCLVNDWSARDIQKWEYQPLGPFNAKNFCTSISPWIVTLDALEPFRCAGPEQNPRPLPYLRDDEPWSFDIDLEVSLRSADMTESQAICRSNFKHLYWNIRQQLAHHTITGCNVRPGDMMASGTISAPDPEGYGSLLELTWRGTKPITLRSGKDGKDGQEDQQRSFLADGDTVTITGWAQGGAYRIGFGVVRGTIEPALALENVTDHAEQP